MKGIRFSIIDFLKIISIATIGASNSITLMLLCTKVFKSSSMNISCLVLMGIATILAVATFLNHKKRVAIRKRKNLLRNKIILS